MYNYFGNSLLLSVLGELRAFRSFRGPGQDRSHTIWTWLCLRSIEGLSRVEQSLRLSWRS
jgi:hypothetical protein